MTTQLILATVAGTPAILYPLIIALISILPAIYKAIWIGINLHDEIFFKRKFRKLDFLIENTTEETSIGITEYLQRLKNTEAFRATSRLTTTPGKVVMLTWLFNNSLITNSEIKRVAYYLLPKCDKIEVNIDLGSKINFLYSCFISLYLLVTALAAAASLILIRLEPQNILVMLVIAIVFFLLSIVISHDYRTYKILQKLRYKLLDQNKLANPESNISLNISKQIFQIICDIIRLAKSKVTKNIHGRDKH